MWLLRICASHQTQHWKIPLDITIAMQWLQTGPQTCRKRLQLWCWQDHTRDNINSLSTLPDKRRWTHSESDNKLPAKPDLFSLLSRKVSATSMYFCGTRHMSVQRACTFAECLEITFFMAQLSMCWKQNWNLFSNKSCKPLSRIQESHTYLLLLSGLEIWLLPCKRKWTCAVGNHRSGAKTHTALFWWWDNSSVGSLFSKLWIT